VVSRFTAGRELCGRLCGGRPARHQAPQRAPAAAYGRGTTSAHWSAPAAAGTLASLGNRPAAAAGAGRSPRFRHPAQSLFRGRSARLAKPDARRKKLEPPAPHPPRPGGVSASLLALRATHSFSTTRRTGSRGVRRVDRLERERPLLRALGQAGSASSQSGSRRRVVTAGGMHSQRRVGRDPGGLGS
jgi:hypothetical protein